MNTSILSDCPWFVPCENAHGGLSIDNRGIGIGNLSRDAAPCVLRFRSSLPILNGVSGTRVVVCD